MDWFDQLMAAMRVTPKARPLEVNDLVYFKDPGLSARYGVVVSVRQDRCNVRFIDPDTGLPMKCPDERCGGERETCPICSRGAKADGLVRFDEHDVEFYTRTGMIHSSLTTKEEAR